MTKRVAIGIPVYNGEDFLAEAIESILGQSFGDFDLIISDNASTDGTEDICRRYARQDKRVSYVRQAHNLGAAVNYNMLFTLSKAEYFKWAAHDDLIGPDFLAACVAALDADPGIVLAMSGTVLIDEHGSPLPFSAERGGLVDRGGICWPAMPEKNGDLASPDPVARFEALVLRTILCVEIFGLMRRSAMARTMKRGQGSYLGADKTFLAELCLRGRFWMGREPLFFRRCHARQYSVAGKSDTYRAEWFGRRGAAALLHTMPVQKLIFLQAYCRAIAWSELTARQRYACLRIIARRALLRGKIWLGADSAEIHDFYPARQGTAMGEK